MEALSTTLRNAVKKSVPSGIVESATSRCHADNADDDIQDDPEAAY